FRGVLWHQGESDAHNGVTAEQYQQMLTRLIARLREDLAQPELPFVIGGLYDNHTRDAVTAGQRATGAAVSGTAYVGVDGLTTIDQNTHFDAASQITLGERFARAIVPLQQP